MDWGKLRKTLINITWYMINDTNTVYFSTYASQDNKILLGTKDALYFLIWK